MRPLEARTKSSAELSRFLGIDQAGSDFIFTGITSSTQFVQEGDLFIALPGARRHGAEFADEVFKNGAVAILTDKTGAAMLGKEVPSIIVQNPRLILGDLSAWFYDSPFRSLEAVGITGTNGKTTTASLLHQLWQLSNRESGFIGTVGISMGSETFPTQFTTPESPELQAVVATMIERNVRHLVMEVSSHSIAARRVASTSFSNVAFTNLTQDHLDFHGDMETYFQEKAKIFTPEFARQGFVNVDDSYGRKLVEMAQISLQTISRTSTLASWHYSSYQISGNGYDVAIRGLGGILIEGHLPLVGEHNLDNALMAIALAVESGIDPLAIAMDMHKLKGPAGRLEKVDIGQKYLAFVDYAHTPDAVERVLAAVRQITPGRVIAILGCGGDRDSSKRSLMGKSLVNGSDFAVLTSDNPRSENPLEILSQMSADVVLGENVVLEEDRRGAIAVAIAEATPGDTVILLGKGHEVGQEINGIKYPFDDRIELAQAIERLS